MHARAEVGLVALVFVAACGESQRSDGGSSGTSGTSGASGVGGTAGESGVGGTAGAAGSEPTSGAGPYFGSGSRLKPIIVRLDGVDVFSGTWWDTELAVQCRFEFYDSTCVPWQDLPQAYTFEDSNCTMPLVRALDPGCYAGFSELAPKATLGPVLDGDGSCAGLGVYRVVGEAFAPTAVYSGEPGSCTAFTPDSGTRYFRAEHVPSTTLVTSSFVVRERAPGMSAYVRENSDGSWAIERFFDPERELSCAPASPLLAPANRCIPQKAGPASGFIDDACRVQGVEPVECGEQPKSLVVTENAPSACDPTPYRVFLLGDPVESSLYGNGAGTCTALADEPTTLYPADTEIEPASLPNIDELEVGDGQFRARFFAFGGVPFLPVTPDDGIVDRETSERCDVLPFRDGKRRCVPRGNGWLRDSTGNRWAMFADASCTGTRVVTRPEGCETGAPRGVLLTSGFPAPGRTDECTWQIETVHSVAPLAGTVAYQATEDGACQAIDLGASRQQFYAVAASIDSGVFPEIEALIAE